MKMLLYSLKKELADERSGLKRINLEGNMICLLKQIL